MIWVLFLLLEPTASFSLLQLGAPRAVEQVVVSQCYDVLSSKPGHLLVELRTHQATSPLALMASRGAVPRCTGAGFVADAVDESGWAFNKSEHYLALAAGNWTVCVHCANPVSYDIQAMYSEHPSCPRNCSGNGGCVGGRCHCLPHFIDGDCSLFTSRLELNTHVVIPTPAKTWSFLALEEMTESLNLFVTITPEDARAHLYLRCGEPPLMPASPLNATQSIDFSEEDESSQVLGVPCPSSVISVFNAGSSSATLAFDAKRAPKAQRNNMVYIVVAVIVVVSLSWSCAYVLNSAGRQRVSMAQTDVGGGLAQHVVDTLFPATSYESDDKAQCPICLELMLAGSVVRTLACKHVFHASCIDHWFLLHTVLATQFCCVCKHDCSIQQSVMEEGETIALEEQ